MNKRLSSRHKRKAPQFIWERLRSYLTSKNFESEKFHNTKAVLYYGATLRKTIETRKLCSPSRVFRVIHDSRQSSGCNLQTHGMRRTSKRCSISLHQSENGGRSRVVENSGFGMFDHVGSSTLVPMSKMPAFRWKEMCTDTHWQDGCGSDNSKRSGLKIEGMKFQDGIAFFLHRQQGLFLSVCGRYPNERKEEQPETHVGQIDETIAFGGANTSVRSGKLGCTQS